MKFETHVYLNGKILYIHGTPAECGLDDYPKLRLCKIIVFSDGIACDEKSLPSSATKKPSELLSMLERMM